LRRSKLLNGEVVAPEEEGGGEEKEEENVLSESKIEWHLFYEGGSYSFINPPYR
jgi:hypothetical protein